MGIQAFTDLHDSVGGLLQFQSTWGLDDKCMDYLSSLPQHVQNKVMAEFDHRSDQTNPSARCMAFAKKLLQTQSQDPAENAASSLPDFQARWGIDDRCVAYLAALPPQVLAIVLTNFEHRPDQTNVSARCQAFAKSVLQQSGLAQPQAVAQHSFGYRGGASHALEGVAPAGFKRPREPELAGGFQAESLDLLQFQVQWDLDERCMDYLSSLPPHVQAIVVSKFEHKADQTNPSARCQAFAQSVLRVQQGPNVLQDFQVKWGLDDRCIEFLSTLPQHVQAIVIKGFDHGPGRTNVSARCMGFARSVMQRSGQPGIVPQQFMA
mmetsp:Transcript_98319/g.316964  ORF Transcript_98319/g.316964 Transcript_98319/m.316964 type:complete len:321 (+) Transcript_98319:1122-2084(+)